MTPRPIAAALFVSLIVGRSARAEDAPPIQVEIKGTLLPASDDPTRASTVLGPRALKRPGASTADALQGVPGAHVERTGGSAELATVTLRGASSAETPVYLGPIPLNDELTGTADLSTVPPFFLSRAEVFRGHAPIELEREGLSGAIVLTPSIPSGTCVGASGGVGSFGERFASGLLAFGGASIASATLVRLDRTRGSYLYTDDRGTRFDPSDDVDVVRANADARSIDLWSVTRVDFGDDRGQLDLLARVFSREQGVPGLGLVPAKRARATTRQTIGATSGDAACSADAPSRCRIRVSAWARASSYRLDDPGRELALGTEQQITSYGGAGTRAEIALAPSPLVGVRAGTSLALARIRVDPLGRPDTDASRSSVRAYVAVAVHPAPWLDARAEGAVSSDALESEGNPSAQTSPRGRVAIAARPLGWLELFASGGRYGRVPMLGEQFGVTATVLGNPSLKPEAGWSGDFGARAEGAVGRHVLLASELDLFGRHAEDLIAYERSSFGALEPFNVGSARVLGLEGALVARFFRVLDARAFVALTDARDTSDDRTTANDRLPFQAPYDVGGSVGVRFTDVVRAVRLDEVRADLSFHHRAPRTADPAGLVELPPQSLLEAQASVSFARNTAEIAVRVDNILDDRTTDLVGYPLPGRGGHVSFSAMWR